MYFTVDVCSPASAVKLISFASNHTLNLVPRNINERSFTPVTLGGRVL